MLVMTADPCAGDPQCPAIDPDADLTAFGGAFAGVQTIMVGLAGALVVIAVVGLVLWLRHSSRARTPGLETPRPNRNDIPTPPGPPD